MSDLISPEAEALLAKHKQEVRARRMPVPFEEPPKRLRRKTDAAFKEMVLKKMELYHCDALDALRHLSLVPVDLSNPAMMEVKLKAAAQLAMINKPMVERMEPASDDGILRALNDAYHKQAPRIQSIRERIVTFSSEEKTVIDAPISE